MNDNEKIRETLARHRRELQQRFRFNLVNVAVYAKVFSCAPPDSLIRLYKMEQSLIVSGVAFEIEKSLFLIVQYFYPLDLETMNLGERYHMKFYPFAVSDDGLPLLIDVHNPRSVFTDQAGGFGEPDVEDINVNFDTFVEMACLKLSCSS